MSSNDIHMISRSFRLLLTMLVASALVAGRPTDSNAQFLKKLKEKVTQVTGGAGATADSVAAKADSLSNKSSKISAAASKLTTAVDVIQAKTGVSKSTMLNAALAASGAGLVGAALSAGTGTDKANAGLAAAKAVAGAVKDANGLNLHGSDASLGIDARGYEGAARGYGMQATGMVQQQIEWLEKTAADSTKSPMIRLAAEQQLDMYRLVQRAQQGDTAAARQLDELQRGIATSPMPTDTTQAPPAAQPQDTTTKAPATTAKPPRKPRKP